MTSTEDEVEQILQELRNISMKMQQLIERKKVLCVMKELKKRVGYEPTDETEVVNEQNLTQIEAKLVQLETIRAQLQQRYDRLKEGQAEKPKKASFSGDESHSSAFLSSAPQIFFVEPPPNAPAPTVVLDPDQLQFKATKTQCPECQEFITTEVSTSVSSVTWLACVISIMLGCVAGCCLIPFCLDSFKTTIHKCPKCNTSISTVKKL